MCGLLHHPARATSKSPVTSSLTFHLQIQKKSLLQLEYNGTNECTLVVPSLTRLPYLAAPVMRWEGDLQVWCGSFWSPETRASKVSAYSLRDLAEISCSKIIQIKIDSQLCEPSCLTCSGLYYKWKVSWLASRGLVSSWISLVFALFSSLVKRERIKIEMF